MVVSLSARRAFVMTYSILDALKVTDWCSRVPRQNRLFTTRRALLHQIAIDDISVLVNNQEVIIKKWTRFWFRSSRPFAAAELIKRIVGLGGICGRKIDANILDLGRRQGILAVLKRRQK